MLNLIFGKGKEKILLTKGEYKRARRRFLKRKRTFGLFRDTDRDGFPDYLDGHPRNPRKHSFVAALATGAATTAGSVIVSEIVKKGEFRKKSVC